MLSFNLSSGFLASILLFAATTNAQSAPTPTVAVGPIVTLGCYKDVGNLQNEGSNTFQTSGSCQALCANAGKPVMATEQGSFCFCGDALPPSQYEADNSSCSSPCNGYGQDMCGGIGFWTVYLVGLTGDLVSTQSASSSTAAATPGSTGDASSTTQPAVVTKPGQTVVVTASNTAAPSSGGGSKVGIAVGVVVGVLALAGAIGGGILFMKHRRRREIEEEHRRNAASATYRPEPKNDARLDASAVNARRTSIGSIADEGDYTRRILQVSTIDHLW